MDTAT